MLNSYRGDQWISTELWTCLLTLMNTSFNASTVEVMSTEDVYPILGTNQWAFYINSQLQSNLKPAVIDALLIYKQLPQLNMYGRYNRVAVVTQDLEDVTSLWAKSRLLDTVILHYNDSVVNAYTWYPYMEKPCHPSIQFLDVCVNGKWNQDLYPNKMPKQFHGCPVYYKSSPSPPDAVYTNGTFIGREPELMKILAESLNLSVNYVDISFDFFDMIPQGNSAMAMIKRGEIDFAFSTMVMLIDYNKNAEPLQPYREQPVVWMFPLADPENRMSSIYSGFPFVMWITIIIVLFSSGILIMTSTRISGGVWSFLDLIAALVASAFPTSKSRFIRVFLIYFQFYSLHIAWFYQGTLLHNLINTPMQKQMSDAQEAVDAKMPAYLYPWMSMYFNNSNHELWNQILAEDGHIYSYNIDFERIVERKTAYFLAILVQDGWMMRRKFHRSLAKMVYVKIFINNPVTVYGHRGSPLTARYAKQMLYLIQSGILWHLTALEPEYTDLPDKETSPAKVLEIEPLLGAFILLGGLLVIASVVFALEVIYGLRDGKWKKLCCIKYKERRKRDVMGTKQTWN